MRMQPIATDVARGVHVYLSVCLCVGHAGELCKHGGTARDAFFEREADSCGPKELFLRMGPDRPLDLERIF